VGGGHADVLVVLRAPGAPNQLFLRPRLANLAETF
jgi:hypothetical protein